MISWIADEFKRGPAATVAAYVAIASAVALLFSAASIQLPEFGTSPQPLDSTPLRLLLIGAFALTASYGAAHFLHLIRRATTRFCVSLVAAAFVQAATAVVARHLLAADFVVTAAQYERDATGMRLTSRAVAEIAGIQLDSIVFILSLLIVLIFLGITMGRMEDDEAKQAARPKPEPADVAQAKASAEVDGTLILTAGFVWILLTFIAGGAVMESLMRAGF